MKNCMTSLLEAIKQRDFFAIPVQLTYKGQRKFNTLLGGCCSIILVIGILVSLPLLIVYELNNPEVRMTAPKYNTYLSSKTPEEWIIDTKFTNFAYELTLDSDDVEI